MVLRFDILINCCKTHEVAQDRFAISSLPIFFEIRNFIINIMQPRIKLGCKKKSIFYVFSYANLLTWSNKLALKSFI